MSDFDKSSQTRRKATRICQLRIEGLFGHFNYRIEPTTSDLAVSNNFIILYGDNGSGKTTILKLLFFLLIPRQRQNAKTFIARTPFRLFEVTFDDGTRVAAKKQRDRLVGDFDVLISRPGEAEEVIHFPVNAEGAVAGSDEPLRKLWASLRRVGVALYFLPDDRRVATTFTSEPEDSPDDNSITRWSRMLVIGSGKEETESHHLDVAPVLRELATWLRNHALQGSNAGDENATSIYLRVIQQISNAGGAKSESSSHEEMLSSRLRDLSARMGAFTKFGLISPFPAEKFLAELVSAKRTARSTIATVLEPFVDGLEARLKALEQIRAVIANYVETTNSFLTGKMIEFTLQSGVTIFGYDKVPLKPEMLSSGERQLILLLSNTVLARDAASIFLIDEPELSLNVKWQRRLIDALLKCAQGSNVQYVLATHSLELIAQHRSNAVHLIARDDAS